MQTNRDRWRPWQAAGELGTLHPSSFPLRKGEGGSGQRVGMEVCGAGRPRFRWGFWFRSSHLAQMAAYASIPVWPETRAVGSSAVTRPRALAQKGGVGGLTGCNRRAGVEPGPAAGPLQGEQAA